MPEPESQERPADSQDPIRVRRPWGSIRWFVAEFAVVVSGVLVALALNAYYQGQQEEAREQAYLRQIAADLQESEAGFAAAIESNIEDIEGLSLLSSAFAAPAPSSDADLGGLASIGFKSADLTAGAARALVATGDLHLIRDDSVRTAVIHFVSVTEGYSADLQRVEWEWIRPSILAFYSATRPTARGDHPFAVRIPDLLEDPEFFTMVEDLRLAFVNYVRLQERMIEAIRETGESIGASLHQGTPRPAHRRGPGDETDELETP